MTDKEKAKAFDEALERARKMLNMILDNELLGFPDQIREIFPQLRESEDERIRKALIDAFQFHKKLEHVTFYGVPSDDAIAYLERQKTVDYEAELKKCKDNPLYFFDKYVSIKLKPMKWSEEDEKMCNSILNILTPHLVYDGTYTGTTLGKKYKYGSEIRWIKSLPERFNLQPKEEQSKYDGNMDKECIKLCNTLNSIPSIDTFESCCGHLKDSYSVWFFCNDIIAISRLGRCVERNYSDGKWELLVDSTDTHPTGVFWLRSKVPFQSYDEMEESVNELCVCIQYWFNTKFDSYFNDDACK